MRLSSQITAAIAALGLTIPEAARQIGGDAGYKATLKRLHRYTSDPPVSLSLLESDLQKLGLKITIEQ